MPRLSRQKSSYCGEGDSCAHVATAAQAIHMTESADPSGAILTITPDDFLSLLQALKGEREMTADRPPAVDVTVEDDLTVLIHTDATPDTTDAGGTPSSSACARVSSTISWPNRDTQSDDTTHHPWARSPPRDRRAPVRSFLHTKPAN